ncbi:hypothetical protein GF323_03655 [Candidatus Woesearchaeota archaeon]|nr:hypothetical protein [Candidatus Woesearchaeota archaeon]
MKTQNIEKTILLVPLFIAFFWMAFLVLDTQSADIAMKLAPSRLDTLVNVLFLFIVLYAVVLIFLFIRMGMQLKKQEKKKK